MEMQVIGLRLVRPPGGSPLVNTKANPTGNANATDFVHFVLTLISWKY